MPPRICLGFVVNRPRLPMRFLGALEGARESENISARLGLSPRSTTRRSPSLRPPVPSPVPEPKTYLSDSPEVSSLSDPASVLPRDSLKKFPPKPAPYDASDTRNLSASPGPDSTFRGELRVDVSWQVNLQAVAPAYRGSSRIPVPHFRGSFRVIPSRGTAGCAAPKRLVPNAAAGGALRASGCDQSGSLRLGPNPTGGPRELPGCG